MIYNFKKIFTTVLMVIFGSVLLYNCEPEADNFGVQLFDGDGATGKELSFGMIAYNINNGDAIRSDAARLTLGTLGAFNESQFGLQKASYITQARLSTYNPDFGANAVMDSAVLVLKPVFEASTDSLKTTTDENYIYPVGTVAAKKVFSTSPVRKYGRAKINGAVPNFTLRVSELQDFLGGTEDSILSNKDFPVTTLLGTKVFNGNVTSVNITKDSDNSAIFTSTNDIRVNLDATFFQNKIINKKGQPELKEVANFIRYFRGIKISVDESDGYLFQINPADMEIVLYYKNDKIEGTTNLRPQNTFKLALGTGNVHAGSYQYNRAGSQFPNYVSATPNTTTGDNKLFLQGMGGPSVGLKFPPATLDSLKLMYSQNKAAVINAKVRLYTDEITWKNSYRKPNVLTIVETNNLTGKSGFTLDLKDYAAVVPGFAYLRAYDLEKNPAYYDFIITKTVKSIIEEGNGYENKNLRIDIGDFIRSQNNNALINWNLTTRPFAVERIQLVGSGNLPLTNAKRVKLRVIYGTK
ncbi:hypothetical protein ASG01_12285 [Chryseobacterium sp. Leaf180]|uniref:DUF4270 family protein n=1 Tax=Chryseobacterium sp. Leaf180 TaxID=1736289 RepID=UPI0006FF2C4F|nr:DUF4270 family protein [Chryseobacterium sp. Leaf180]KQR92668.1 hypothetical protein ASG01_12285 [Chryseobacterium sp. Leaf180]